MKLDLLVKKSGAKGRGVFSTCMIKKGQIIEICPVIILKNKDRKFVDKTGLYSYYFWWGSSKKQTAIALGYGSLYNHSYSPNAVYSKNQKQGIIFFKALRDVIKNEEITINYNLDLNDESPLWFKVK